MSLENSTNKFSVVTNIFAFCLVFFCIANEFRINKDTYLNALKLKFSCKNLNYIFGILSVCLLVYLICFFSNTIFNSEVSSNPEIAEEIKSGRININVYNILFGIINLAAFMLISKYIDFNYAVIMFIVMTLVIISMIMNITVLVKEKSDEEVIKTAASINTAVYAISSIVIVGFMLGAIWFSLFGKSKDRIFYLIPALGLCMAAVILVVILSYNSKTIKDINSGESDEDQQRKLFIAMSVFGLMAVSASIRGISKAEDKNTILMSVKIVTGLFVFIFSCISLFYNIKSVIILDKKTPE